MAKNTLQEAYRGRGWANYPKANFKEAIEDFNKALDNIFRGRSWAYYRID